MKIEEFCMEMIRDLARFHAWWAIQNAENPEQYPLESGEDNSGMWDEQFRIFQETVPEEPQP